MCKKIIAKCSNSVRNSEDKKQVSNRFKGLSGIMSRILIQKNVQKLATEPTFSTKDCQEKEINVMWKKADAGSWIC